MYTELVVGKETFRLNENGENLQQTFEFSGLASQVPIFIHMIKGVETHFISMKYPSEEQSELINVMEQIEAGYMPFESEEEMHEFSKKYEEVVEEGVFNQEIIDLGGVGLNIYGDKYTLKYFFDGICPSEQIYNKEGALLSEISREKIYISLMGGDKLCNFDIKDVTDANLGIHAGNSVEEFIKVSLNDETLPSVGVIYNEFSDNKKLEKSFKRIYKQAYNEKNNALANVVSSVIDPDGNLMFLMNVTQGFIDAGLAVHPDKQFVYSI